MCVVRCFYGKETIEPVQASKIRVMYEGRRKSIALGACVTQLIARIHRTMEETVPSIWLRFSLPALRSLTALLASKECDCDTVAHRGTLYDERFLRTTTQLTVDQSDYRLHTRKLDSKHQEKE